MIERAISVYHQRKGLLPRPLRRRVSDMSRNLPAWIQRSMEPRWLDEGVPLSTWRARAGRATNLADRAQQIAVTPTYSWHGMMKQRPQHMALGMGSLGYDVWFGDPSVKRGEISKAGPGVYRTAEFAHALSSSRVCILEATDLRLSRPMTEEIRERTDFLVYEWLDDFSHSLQGRPRHDLASRHAFALANADLVLVTAKSLAARSRDLGAQRVLYSPNACDPLHFAEASPQLDRRSRPVVGYFGAIASWLDFGLIRDVATLRPDYVFVFLGIDYDGSVGRLPDLPNVEYRGSINYELLPRVLDFTVAWIPFAVNQVTLATSPVKMFEYLAAGLEVAAPLLPEVYGFPHVNCFADAQQCVAILDDAIQTFNIDVESRRRIAQANSWKARCTDLSAAISSSGPDHGA
jgi:teichuronic acid biosynthesis glycosyltransferase TuaH